MAGLAVIFVLGGWILMLELRLKKLFKGRRGKDLEEIILETKQEVKSLFDSKEEMEKHLQNAEARLKNSVQNVKTIRFNPFGDAGSNQSFVISFLSEHGDGVVLSGLYSREKVNVFAKPIEKFDSKFTLSKEEKEAIRPVK